jgi:hypothetical protein
MNWVIYNKPAINKGAMASKEYIDVILGPLTVPNSVNPN